MQVLKCDRCGKEMNPIYRGSNTVFPVLKISVIHNYNMGIHDSAKSVDLCSKCKNEVYDFIFGRNDDANQ